MRMPMKWNLRDLGMFRNFGVLTVSYLKWLWLDIDSGHNNIQFKRAKRRDIKL